MNQHVAAIAIFGLLCSSSSFAQPGGQPPPPATDTVAPDIPGVVAGGTKVQVIKEGFQGTEGPIGLPDGSLIFTETNANRITKIDKDNNVSTFLENTNGSNGLAFDAKGRLITVQTTPGQTKIGVVYPKGSETVLADGFEGKPFGRPNDLVVDKKGGVYFTEPGPNAQPGTTPAAPPLPPAVYYVPPGGRAIKIADGIERPNGIQLSRDEKTLYVNNTNGEYRARVRHSTGWHRAQPAQLREVRKRDADRQRRQQRSGWSRHRQPGPRVRRGVDRSAGVQPSGPAPGHDSVVARAAESRLRRAGQENALRRRPRCGVQDPDGGGGVQRSREVAQIGYTTPRLVASLLRTRIRIAAAATIGIALATNRTGRNE